MYNKERLSCCGRLLTIVLCLIFGFFIFVNSNKIHNAVQENIFPVVADYFYGPDTQKIDSILKTIMDKNEHISSVVVYKFEADIKTSIYKGQSVVAMRSNFINKEVSVGDYELINSKNQMQNILLNKIQYDNTRTIKVLCENLVDLERVYSCDKFKTIDLRHKSIVSIPILDTDLFGVIGYVTITLDTEYSNREVKDLVNNSKLYLSKMEKIIKHNP